MHMYPSIITREANQEVRWAIHGGIIMTHTIDACGMLKNAQAHELLSRLWCFGILSHGV
jgi:hypothetical protein